MRSYLRRRLLGRLFLAHPVVRLAMPTPTLTLFSVSGSFPFQTKHLPLSPGTKITLGSTEGTSTGMRQSIRVPSTNNGWFPPKQTGGSTVPPVSPLPLSSSHAEVWLDGGNVRTASLRFVILLHSSPCLVRIIGLCSRPRLCLRYFCQRPENREKHPSQNGRHHRVYLSPLLLYSAQF